MKLKIESCTAAVLRALEQDIQTEEQLKLRLPTRPAKTIRTTIVYLLQRKAIAFIADEQTTLYYPTPEQDDRLFKVDEHAPTHGFKRRANKVGV